MSDQDGVLINRSNTYYLFVAKTEKDKFSVVVSLLNKSFATFFELLKAILICSDGCDFQL